MHDFAISENHAIFFDLPMVFKPENLLNGFPIEFDINLGARCFSSLSSSSVGEPGSRGRGLCGVRFGTMSLTVDATPYSRPLDTVCSLSWGPLPPSDDLLRDFFAER